MNDDILYRRPKQSDMMQGISDSIRATSLEFQRMRKFGYYLLNCNYPNIENEINMIENHLGYWDKDAQMLREKGL